MLFQVNQRKNVLSPAKTTRTAKTATIIMMDTDIKKIHVTNARLLKDRMDTVSANVNTLEKNIFKNLPLKTKVLQKI